MFNQSGCGSPAWSDPPFEITHGIYKVLSKLSTRVPKMKCIKYWANFPWNTRNKSFTCLFFFLTKAGKNSISISKKKKKKFAWERERESPPPPHRPPRRPPPAGPTQKEMLKQKTQERQITLLPNSMTKMKLGNMVIKIFLLTSFPVHKKLLKFCKLCFIKLLIW